MPSAIQYLVPCQLAHVKLWGDLNRAPPLRRAGARATGAAPSWECALAHMVLAMGGRVRVSSVWVIGSISQITHPTGVAHIQHH